MISTFILAARRFNPVCDNSHCKERGEHWLDNKWLCPACFRALWHKLELERAA
jgi:hypothetical protein